MESGLDFLYLVVMVRISKLFLVLVSCSLLSGISATKLFTIRILQDGMEVPIKKNEVTLDKKPFVIEFSLVSPMGILVNASFDEQSFNISKNKKNGMIPGFHETGMAEDVFNKQKEIMISDQAPNYWYYETDEFNRFDKIEKKDGKIICTRTVEQLNRVAQSLTIPLEKVSAELYLVFLVTQRGKSEEADKELQRERLLIKWK
jgi:hypothetical protein